MECFYGRISAISNLIVHQPCLATVGRKKPAYALQIHT